MTLKSDPRSYSQLRSKRVIVTLESRKMYCATTIPRYKPPLPLHEEDVGHCSGASMPHGPVRVGRGILIAFGVFGEDRAGRVQEVNSALDAVRDAQRDGDFAQYGEALQRLNDAMDEYQSAD